MTNERQMTHPTQRQDLPDFKPVMQTVFGSRGNCMSACLASLLGLPIGQVPNFFDKSESDDHWWELVREWLKEHGLGVITINYSQELMEKIGGVHIVAGLSARDVNHAVLYKDGKLFHDPHPDNTGVEPETWDLIFPLNTRAHPENTQPQIDGWQPIETAPKDGTQFLGYIPELGYKNDRGKLQGCNVHVCWYGHSYSENKDRFHIYAIGAFAEEIIPTHWMPLPPPPHPKDDE